MGLYVGIDLGTSSVKALVADERGAILGQASRDYELSCPAPGWKEMDAELWWERSLEALDEALGDLDRSLVRAVGVTGQMHTVVALDAQGDAVRPALMWNDVRTRELVPGLREAFAEAGETYLSRVVSTGSPAANLLWLRLNEPESFARMSTFLIGPDWLVHRLTGALCTDFCEASTSSLYSLSERRWSQAACEAVGVPLNACPEVCGSACSAGTVRPEVAGRFGLGPNVTVTVGTGDNPAAAIPTGCLTGGAPVLSLGTSGVLMFSRPAPDFEARGKNILFSFDGGDCLTLVQGALQSCGSSYSWWNRTVLGVSAFSVADAGIDLDALGKGDVLFFPHLTGEKTIYADPDLRGAFLGLSTDVSRAELTLAVMEGIAFGARQLADEMRLPRSGLEGLRAIGGGSKSDVWMQVLADVLGVEVERATGESSAGYGAVLLAMRACPDEGAQRAAGEGVAASGTQGERFRPRERAVALYDEKYRRYLRIHDALKSVYR